MNVDIGPETYEKLDQCYTVDGTYPRVIYLAAKKDNIPGKVRVADPKVYVESITIDEHPYTRDFLPDHDFRLEMWRTVEEIFNFDLRIFPGISPVSKAWIEAIIREGLVSLPVLLNNLNLVSPIMQINSKGLTLRFRKQVVADDIREYEKKIQKQPRTRIPPTPSILSLTPNSNLSLLPQLKTDHRGAENLATTDLGLVFSCPFMEIGVDRRTMNEPKYSLSYGARLKYPDFDSIYRDIHQLFQARNFSSGDLRQIVHPFISASPGLSSKHSH